MDSLFLTDPPGVFVTKEQAIAEFFQHNQIDPAQISRYLDPKLERLSEKVDQWLAIVEPSDRELFLRLLSRYTYLTNEASVRRYHEGIHILTEKLQSFDLSLCDLLFISTESSDKRKSGSDHVRTDLHRLCMGQIDACQIVASTCRLSADELAGYRGFVFVDDIVGTGFTLRRTISSFLDQFPDFINAPLFMLCIVPTDAGLSYLIKQLKKRDVNIIPVYNQEWIAVPAFQHADIFAASERDDAIERVRKYEALIDAYMKDPEKSYILGFWGCRQLVSFYYNTPNNTLCTFWRWTDSHTPLFPREKQPQIRLKHLQSVKRKKDDNAYRIKAEQRTEEK